MKSIKYLKLQVSRSYLNRGGRKYVAHSKGTDYSDDEIKSSSSRENEEKSFCHYKGDAYKCQSKGCKDCCLCQMTQRLDHDSNSTDYSLLPDIEKQGGWNQRFMARYLFHSNIEHPNI